MLIVGVIVVVIIVVAAVALLAGHGSSAPVTTSKGSSGTGSGTGTGGNSTSGKNTTTTTAPPGGYTVNCTPYYNEGIVSAANTTCTNATLSNNVLTLQTAAINSTYSNASFYLTSPGSSTMNITGFYINATSPTNATLSPGQTVTVTFDLTSQQVSSLVKASSYGGNAGVGLTWGNATSNGGGLFASLSARGR
jgi:hypothetical protein